jgi:hypothetical protein
LKFPILRNLSLGVFRNFSPEWAFFVDSSTNSN